MIKINIRPLSVNEGYTGKRWKTKAHRCWHNSVLHLLPRNIELPKPPFKIYLTFGITNNFDWDNGIKFICDCIAEKYGFNDKLIRAGNIETELVGKGNEYIEFDLKHKITEA